ncbi:hypothetical protein HY771_01295 [Candidatus Uhrbacteria bacterium]|nr:hypothetical protein [Candidatus Uhrbacteria bacterium]
MSIDITSKIGLRTQEKLMNGAVLQLRKTANVSVDTLRIFLSEKQASHNFNGLLSMILECDVYMQERREEEGEFR